MANTSRGPVPILWSAALVAAGLATWKTAVEPALPPDVQTLQWTRGTFVDVPRAYSPIYRVGEIGPESLVVAGDSRVQSGVSREILDDAGLGPTALLTGPSGQLRDVLRIAREAPARRLVLALSVLSIEGEPDPGFRRQLRRLREPPDRGDVDAALDTWLGDQRRRWITPIATDSWRSSWFGTPDPLAQIEAYRERLRLVSDEARARRLDQAARLLRELVGSGWTVVAVRLPTHPELRTVEDEVFAPDRFVEFCANLGIEYHDLGVNATGYSSRDGSHLLPSEGRRFSHELAKRLAEGVLGANR